MKKLIFFAAASMACTFSFAQNIWKADKMHSQLKFDITHMGLSTVSGGFSDFEASISTSKADFSDAVFEMTAKTESINTGIVPRDSHLKSADFFDATANPTISFKSTSIKKESEGKYKVSGNLTMHGVTKPVTLDLWHRGTVTNPRSKKEVAGFRATGKINRSDFDLAAKMPASALGEEVTITADGEFGQ